MPLTNEIIDASQVPFGKTQLKLSDGGGLYILVKESGKYWKLAYRFGGKQKSLSLGVYPTVSLDMARRRRDEAKQWLAQGLDPGEIKKKQKLERTIPLLTTTATEQQSVKKVQEDKKSLITASEEPEQRTLQQPHFNQLEKRRLVILQRMAANKAFEIDILSLQEELEQSGIKVSYDRLRTDLAWLYEQGVIQLHTGDSWLAALTRAGMDVVADRMWVPGIMQPTPSKEPT